MKSIVVREVHPALNSQHIVLDTHVDAVFTNSGHFQNNSERLAGLENVSNRNKYPSRDGALLLLFHFSLLLDLHFLLCGHDRAPALFM